MQKLPWFGLLLAFGCVVPKPPQTVARPSPAVTRPAAPDAGPAPLTAAFDAGTPNEVTLVAAGDVTLGFHFEEYLDAQLADGGTRDALFAYPFAGVAQEAAQSDLFVVNLECPFTDRGEKIDKNFNFRARPELVEVLRRAGVGAVSIANNHLMDYGPAGVEDTRRTLADAGIGYFGAGQDLAQAREPFLVERNGVRIAFLGYLFLGTHNIEPPEVIATPKTPGVAGHYSDEAQMEAMLLEDIARARDRADLVIPFFHWGREGYNVPQGYQVRLGRAAIRAGAAAVLGSHPHVLEGMELYHGRPIVYSLGNFIFGGNWNPREKRAGMIRLRFHRARGFLNADVIPVVTDRFPDHPFQPYVPEGDDGKGVLEAIARWSSVLQQPLPPLGDLRPEIPRVLLQNPRGKLAPFPGPQGR